jgi:hypothetical protein
MRATQCTHRTGHAKFWLPRLRYWAYCVVKVNIVTFQDLSSRRTRSILPNNFPHIKADSQYFRVLCTPMYQVLIHCLVIAALALRSEANISRRCTQPIFSPSILSAQCTDDSGVQKKSFVDLNNCIGFDSTESKLRCGYCHLCFI